jgi:hypothetical protein
MKQLFASAVRLRGGGPILDTAWSVQLIVNMNVGMSSSIGYASPLLAARAARPTCSMLKLRERHKGRRCFQTASLPTAGSLPIPSSGDVGSSPLKGQLITHYAMSRA